MWKAVEETEWAKGILYSRSDEVCASSDELVAVTIHFAAAKPHR